MFTNFNLWYVLIPAFLVEAMLIGYLKRDTEATNLSSLAMSLVFIINSVIIHVSIWHDSCLGIIQAAEDMCVGYENPISALFLIEIGLIVACGIYIGIQYLCVDFGEFMLPRVFEKICWAFTVAKYYVWSGCSWIQRACRRMWYRHYRRQISAESIAKAAKRCQHRTVSDGNSTMLVVNVRYKPVFHLRAVKD